MKLRKLSTQMHQYSALLVAPFVVFHLCGLYMDRSVPFTWTSLLVPFMDAYRVVPVGLGVLVLYGWVVIVVSSYFRERIGVKLWRRIHISAFPMFIAVTIHGLLTGSDTGKLWSDLVYIVPSALLLLIMMNRFGGHKQPKPNKGVPRVQQVRSRHSR